MKLFAGLLMLLSYQSNAIVGGAGFTTFDQDLQGCKQTEINCNHYEKKKIVFATGGPQAAGLDDGWYYFAVLVPGYQYSGLMDGSKGNLSDTTKGPKGDKGSGDLYENRLFRVENGEIVEKSSPIDANAPEHAWGSMSDGRQIIQLIPFDDTANRGGVYILALCQAHAPGQAPAGYEAVPSMCKYDAFKVKKSKGGPTDDPFEFPVISGAKYFDTNGNGQRDAGEEGIAGWAVDIDDVVDGQVMSTTTVLTDANGNFSVEVLPGDYRLEERLPAGNWIQTGNTVNQSVSSTTVSLNNFVYDIIGLDYNGFAEQLLFGNICLGNANGNTLGFWHNQNGAAVVNSDLNSLAELRDFYLRNQDGTHFDPFTHPELSAWLIGGNAENMANMLSIQMSASFLNYYFLSNQNDVYVYAPGTDAAAGGSFANLVDLINEANTSLMSFYDTREGGLHSAERAHQEVLKNFFDAYNNGLPLVIQSKEACLANGLPDFFL